MLKLLSNIKEAVTILSVVAAIGFGYWGKLQSQEASRATSNLYSKTIQWEDEKGRLVTETSELRFTTQELRNINRQDSARLNEVQKKLWKASKAIEDLKVKERNVESVNIVGLEARRDSLVTIPVYNEDNVLKELKPIKTDNLLIEFEVTSDTIYVNHLYTSEITTVVSRKVDKFTSKGRKRLFLARWVNPRWEYTAMNVSDDPNAEITSAINIKFQKNKGKRE